MEDANSSNDDQMLMLDEPKKHMLLVKKIESDKAYVIDYTDVMKPKSIRLEIKRSFENAHYNLYSAILPRLHENSKKRHRAKSLQKDSFEYEIISKLFLDTFDGARGVRFGPFGGGGGFGAPAMNRARGNREPNIQCILKLENRPVQMKFLNELKANFEKFPNKSPT